MTPNKLPPLPELIRIGGLMSNAAYNLAQSADLPQHARDSLDDLRRQWDEALRQSQSLPAGAVAGLVGKWRDEAKVSAITYQCCLRECADELEQALQADAREKGEAVAWQWRYVGQAEAWTECTATVYAVMTARPDVYDTRALYLATQPAQASEADDYELACSECGYVGTDFGTVHYPAGDADAQCPKCHAVECFEPHELIRDLIRDRDASRAATSSQETASE